MTWTFWGMMRLEFNPFLGGGKRTFSEGNKALFGELSGSGLTGPEKAALDFILLFNSKMNSMNQCNPQESERSLLSVKYEKASWKRKNLSWTLKNDGKAFLGLAFYYGISVKPHQISIKINYNLIIGLVIFKYFSLKTWLKVGISLTFLTLDFWIGFQPDRFRLTCFKEPPHFCTIISLPKIFQPPTALCTFRELFILRDADEVVPFLCSCSTVFSVFFSPIIALSLL